MVSNKLIIEPAYGTRQDVAERLILKIPNGFIKWISQYDCFSGTKKNRIIEYNPTGSPHGNRIFKNSW